MDPSPEEVSLVIEVTDLDPQEDRGLVIQALKNNNRNVQAVISLFYDNPQSFRQKYSSTWDDSLFSADRDGNPNTSGISFHIESLHESDAIQGVTPPPPPEGYPYVAPSRPPSRSNNRSPLSKMIDWTAGDAPGTANPQSQEDDDMQRALRESAQEAGIAMPDQETGVVDNSATAPYFGPANRTDYEQGDWAMVPVAGAESRTSTAPNPSNRKRADGAPAFLIKGVSAAGDHRLGGLLTILHQIPLARNVFLQTGAAAATYGFNSEWWKGREILPPHVLAQLQSGQIGWSEEEATRPDMEEELHRLVAFLDASERSYASVSVLTDLLSYSGIGPEKQFYEQLGMRNGEMLQPLSQVAALVSVSDDDLGDEDAKFGLLEIEHLRSEYSNITTLYESIDHIMWNDVLTRNGPYEDNKMAVFKEMGEVFVIQLGGDGPENSIDIPVEFYPERYLASRKKEARQIQIALSNTKAAMAGLAEKEQSINEWRNDWNQMAFDRRAMIARASNQWGAYDDYLSSLARFRGMEACGFDTNEYPDYRAAPPHGSDIEEAYLHNVKGVMQLTERVLSDMDEKMKHLNVELEQIKAKQRFLGQLLTIADKPGREKPMTCNKYLLRGIASRTDIVYVCRRLEPNLVDLEDEPKALDQWWRLAYNPNDPEPITSEKMTVSQVLERVWTETKIPILVYGTEAALTTTKLPLSGPLDRFVKADNKAFRQELNQESTESSDAKRSGRIDPISPSKRKHRSDSMDSMNSNHASIGSDDRNGFDNPFEDSEQNTGVEMTDMSTADPNTTDSYNIGKTLVGAGNAPSFTDNTATQAGNTSTSGTIAADENETSFPANAQLGAVDRSITMDDMEDEVKGLEMQQRQRPLTFVTTPSVTESTREQGNMDMELSDQSP